MQQVNANKSHRCNCNASIVKGVVATYMLEHQAHIPHLRGWAPIIHSTLDQRVYESWCASCLAPPHHLATFALADVLGDVGVDDDDVSLGIHPHILRLEVAVQVAALVPLKDALLVYHDS